jgi:hypothetical protein
MLLAPQIAFPGHGGLATINFAPENLKSPYQSDAELLSNCPAECPPNRRAHSNKEKNISNTIQEALPTGINTVKRIGGALPKRRASMWDTHLHGKASTLPMPIAKYRLGPGRREILPSAHF